MLVRIPISFVFHFRFLWNYLNNATPVENYNKLKKFCNEISCSVAVAQFKDTYD